jgi:pimeloyl-ACP methyl ester carboxylesterase
MFVMGVLSLGSLGAAEVIPGLEAILRPWRTDLAALSPDGRYLAYPELGNDGSDRLVLISIDDPTQKEVLNLLPFRGVHAGVRVASLLWAGSRDLVIATNIASVLAVEVPGQNLRKLVNADDVAATSLHLIPSRRPQPKVGHGFEVAETASDTTSRSSVLFGGSAPNNGTSGVDETNIQITPSTPAPEQRVPRSPLLIASDPRESGSVLIEAAGVFFQDSAYDAPTALFRIRLTDGKIEALGSGSAEGNLIFDRQGLPRILQGRMGDPVPSFRYAASPGQWDKWLDMDKLFGADFAFDLTPENYAGERSFPVAFCADPDLLYYASNIGRDTFGLYGLNPTTKARTALLIGSPDFDIIGPEPLAAANNLIFDRRGRLVGARFLGLNPTTEWLDSELAGIQSDLEKKFRHRFVQVLDWDDARDRILTLISSDQDPGRYYIYDRTKNLTVEFMRRAPWLEPDEVNAASSLSVTIPGGPTLTGYLTLPKRARLKRAPLIVFCHDGPWARALPGYDREAQALASAGFAVWQVNYRGSDGFGVAFRTALRSAIDRIPLEDILASIDDIATRYPVDPHRMGLFGRGFGGYLALRGLQLFPDRFHCAVSIDAPTDLVWWRDGGAWEEERRAWSRQTDLDNAIESYRATAEGLGPQGSRLAQQELVNDMQAVGAGRMSPLREQSGADLSAAGWRAFLSGDKQKLSAISPLSHPELISQPLLLIQDPQDSGVTLEPGRKLRDALGRRHAAIKYQEIAGAFVRPSAKATAEVVTLAADFFNLTLYNFEVKIGESKPTNLQP